MSQSTPAELNKAASWMSNDDLSNAAKAVFGTPSSNERNQAASMALVRELAARGIDPHTLGYRGGFVPLNPNPKKDPTVKAAEKVARDRERAVKKERAEAAKAKREAESEAAKRKRAAEAEHRVQARDAKRSVQNALRQSQQDVAERKRKEGLDRLLPTG